MPSKQSRKRIQNRSLTKQYGVPVYRLGRNGIPFMFIDEVPKEQQKALSEFMAYQTCPLVDIKRWSIYLWDYGSFLRYKSTKNIPAGVWD